MPLGISCLTAWDAVELSFGKRLLLGSMSLPLPPWIFSRTCVRWPELQWGVTLSMGWPGYYQDPTNFANRVSRTSELPHFNEHPRQMCPAFSGPTSVVRAPS